MYDAVNSDLGLQFRFDNRFTDTLPADPESGSRRRQVSSACYSFVNPTPVSDPRLISFSQDAAELLDIPDSQCNSPLFRDVFVGNRLLPGMKPFAMRYGGHQFGNWAGQLGDGRAINLGEIVNKENKRWVLQLKGAGLTPYSRSADGLAVLRSSLREYICSEAMHHLGIPTTRALSLILTGEEVLRDMFYNGNPKNEPGTVVCRISPSFIRFGNFEILAAHNETELLRRLVDYTIATDFPEISGADDKDRLLTWFAEVCSRTAKTIIHWMRVGFVHGVMNTDNMSILGLTIDYGPYGWLEGYDPAWTPNTTDAQGRRYCFGNQPAIAQWNLHRLANAVFPLIGEAEPLQQALDVYRTTFETEYQHMMAAKLGFFDHEPDDHLLISRLLELLAVTETDMTIFFRTLADADQIEITDHSVPDLFKQAYYQPREITPDYVNAMNRWLTDYRSRLSRSSLHPQTRKEKMNRVNPRFVFRNYLAQMAIDKAEGGDYSMITELLSILRNPYDEQPESETFAAPRPEWARNRPGCSMLSCSS